MLSFVYLSYTETRQADLNYQKNWWVVYFNDARNEEVGFTIENHSKQNNFHWEILVGENKIKEGEAHVSLGEKKKMDFDVVFQKGKITIVVSDGAEKKEIYKNF